MSLNRSRAKRGREVLAALEPIMKQGARRDNLTDALADILHATKGKLDVEDCARMARSHYNAETLEPITDERSDDRDALNDDGHEGCVERYCVCHDRTAPRTTICAHCGCRPRDATRDELRAIEGSLTEEDAVNAHDRQRNGRRWMS